MDATAIAINDSKASLPGKIRGNLILNSLWGAKEAEVRSQIHRRNNSFHNPGAWDLPGGEIEADRALCCHETTTTAVQMLPPNVCLTQRQDSSVKTRKEEVAFV